MITHIQQKVVFGATEYFEVLLKRVQSTKCILVNMNINEADRARLDDFIRMACNFIDSKKEQSNLSENDFVDSDGFVTRVDNPQKTEYVGQYLLDINFQSHLLTSFSSLVKEMLSNAKEPLFGFAERSLYEYITTWVFLYSHVDVKPKHKRRIKTLMFAGFFLLVEKNNKNYQRYLEKNQEYLTPANIKQLELSQSVPEYYRYIGQVAKDSAYHYGFDKRHSFLKDVGIEIILGHQHMRVHANPFSILESISELEKESRHLLLIAYYLMQVITYLKSSDPKDYERLNYRYNKFIKNNKITL